MPPVPGEIDAAFAAGDLERAIDLVEAAGRALFSGDLRLPLERLEGWLELLRPQVNQRPWLLYYQAWIWSAQRRHAPAAVALRRVEHLLAREMEGSEPPGALVLVKLAQGVVAEREGDLAAARAAFAVARDLLGDEREPEPWIAPADAARWRACDPAGACGFYLEAIPTFAAAGEPVPLSRCLHNLALELLRRGEPAMARQAARRTVEIKRAIATDASLANSLNALGMAERWLGLYDRARSTLREARALAERGSDRLVAAYATNNLAEVERDAGDYDLADSLYAESLAAKEALGDEYGTAYGLQSRAVLARWRGRLDDARALLERALRLREPITSPHEAAEMRLEQGLEALAAGERDAARVALGEARLMAEEIDAKGCATLAGLALAVLDRDEGALRAALATGEQSHFAPLVELEHAALRRALPDLAPGRAEQQVDAARPLPPLRAWVLGEFRLEIAGRPVRLEAWRSKRAGELVRALVAARGRSVPRDDLMEWLWPESRDPRAGFNAAVNAARRGLERVGGPGPWIVREANRYRLAGLVWVDADALAARFEAARVARARGALQEAQAALDDARALLGGEPHGSDRYAEWAAPERARLLEIGQLVREGSAAVALELGRFDDAVLAAVEAIAAERSRESAHRLLIAAYLARGDRASAARALAALRAALADELGVAPSAETEALLGE